MPAERKPGSKNYGILERIFIPGIDAIIPRVISMRVVAIYGTLGFGKTALAFAIARHLLHKSYVDGVISNVPHCLPPGIYGDDGMINNKCVILDEAWMSNDARTSMTNTRSYGGFARKFRSVWLFPTVHEIDKRLRALLIEPVKKTIKGESVWSLSTAYNGYRSEILRFKTNPKDVYGLYSTEGIPSDDGGIEMRYAASFYKKTHTPYQFSKDFERQQLQAMAASVTDEED